MYLRLYAPYTFELVQTALAEANGCTPPAVRAHVVRLEDDDDHGHRRPLTCVLTLRRVAGSLSSKCAD